MDSNVAFPTTFSANVPTFGPDSDKPRIIPASMRKFMLKSTKYVGSLALFDQYIVWRYTAGSASINSFLIFDGKVTNLANAFYWCYLFFLYWDNTSKAMNVRGGVPSVFMKKFATFFATPSAFKTLTDEKKKLTTVQELIRLYAITLQKIIMRAPPVKLNFHVYKVASSYDGLPTSASDVPKTVTQRPFNSTTINPHFNFAFFMPEDATGNLFDILVPAGAHALYVPSDFHAYPFEKEVLLPFNCKFIVKSMFTGEIDVIDQESVELVSLQAPNSSFIMGPLYEIDTYSPCLDKRCDVVRKPFTVFLCDYTEK